MSDVQAILYYYFKIYESERKRSKAQKRKNISIVPVYIANEWVFSTSKTSSLFFGKRKPFAKHLAGFLSRVSQKLHRNPIPVRVKNGHRDGDD